MKLSIERFGVYGLYGKRDYEITLDNNQLILVGENGTGKSTIISIFHYLLTSQWHKLVKFDFKSISITVNGETYLIEKDELMYLEESDGTSNDMAIVANRLSELGIDPKHALRTFSRNMHDQLSHDLHISLGALRRILMELSTNQTNLFNDLPDKITTLREKLKLHVLFLPTYRRIERDLKTIFPAMEEDIRRFNRMSNRLVDYRKHMELVEFGMHDVRNLINNTMTSLANGFSQSLDKLTGGYLRVILRKEYENVDVSILKEINENDLEEILQKIDESVLSGEDLRSLRSIIKRFGDFEPTSDTDKLSAHIITQLILLHKHQYEKEKRVRAFASVCNNYLQGKRFEFNNNNFTLPIHPYDDGSPTIVFTEDEINLSMLSSGEKQIVSLFSHLYLSDIDDYFVIIDEPELSLSVPWQKLFLPDILASNKCIGLVAVTHSPFIYANELKDKAHSIQEFLNKSK